jgi:hypothetical protein
MNRLREIQSLDLMRALRESTSTEKRWRRWIVGGILCLVAVAIAAIGLW